MRTEVSLACVECLSRNYRTKKKQTEKAERIEARKFCRRCGVHTLHRETK